MRRDGRRDGVLSIPGSACASDDSTIASDFAACGAAACPTTANSAGPRSNTAACEPSAVAAAMPHVACTAGCASAHTPHHATSQHTASYVTASQHAATGAACWSAASATSHATSCSCCGVACSACVSAAAATATIWLVLEADAIWVPVRRRQRLPGRWRQHLSDASRLGP